MKVYEKDQDVVKILTAAKLPIDQEKKEAALTRICQAVAEKEIRYRPSIWEMIRIQLQYVEVSCLIAQAVVIFLIILILHQMKMQQSGYQEYMMWFSIISSFIGIVGISELGKHISCHMTELEQSCYFNLQQMWGINMIMFGSFDIIVISFLSGIISRRTESEAIAVGVYMLVPFVLSNLCYLLLFTAVRSGGRRYVQLGAAVFMGILTSIPSVIPKAYKINYLWVWVLALSVGVILLIMELRTIFQKISKGDVLCWN